VSISTDPALRGQLPSGGPHHGSRRAWAAKAGEPEGPRKAAPSKLGVRANWASSNRASSAKDVPSNAEWQPKPPLANVTPWPKGARRKNASDSNTLPVNHDVDPTWTPSKDTSRSKRTPANHAAPPTSAPSKRAGPAK